jgi:hypothetical protein
MNLRRCALAAAAALLLGGVTAGCAAPAGPAALCASQTLSVQGGAYTIQNNEWGSHARECIAADGGTGFTVTESAIAIATNATSGAPGGYPSIYKGCHWGACTTGSGLPVRVSAIQPGTVTTSWSTSQPGGGDVYSVAYDIWFNREPASSRPDGTELMIWLNHNGPVHPTGHEAASGVVIGGRGYDVWVGRRGGWKAITYAMTSGTTAVSGLDLQPLAADAMSRGYLRGSWYLASVEAGFELWQGGAGLAVTSFTVTVARGG